MENQEAFYASEDLPPLGKLPLLPRLHCNVLPIVNNITLNRYVHVEGQMNRLQILLLLDQTLFPYLNFSDVNGAFCHRLNTAEYREQMINDFKLAEFYASFHEGNAYVLLSIGYSDNVTIDLGARLTVIQKLLVHLVGNLDHGFPEEVMQNLESMLANVALAPAGKLPLLPRIHHLSLPFNSLSMHQYVRTDGTICRLQIILLLDRRKFPPHVNFAELNMRLPDRLNLAEYKDGLMDEFHLAEFNASFVAQNGFVLLSIAYDPNELGDAVEEFTMLKKLLFRLCFDLDETFPNDFHEHPF